MEATKYVYCAIGKGAVDHSTERRWWKNFRSGCKNLDNEVKSSKPKTMDSEVEFQHRVALG